MLRAVFEQAHAWFLPSRRNDFHPHLLAERGLLILFALILGTEAFLVSNVVSSQTGTPALAAAAGGAANANITTPLPPILAQVANAWYTHVINPLALLSMQPQAGQIAFIVLVVTVALLAGLLTYTLSVRRRHFQKIGYVAGGTMLLFAATFLFFDTDYFLPLIALPVVITAANTNQLATPVFSQTASTAASTTMGTNELPTSTKAVTIKK